MSVQILKVAAKFALPVFIAAFALPAFGFTITYTTTGSFSGCVGCVSSAPSSSVIFDQGPKTSTVTTALFGPATVITLPPTFTTTGNAVTFVDTTSAGELVAEKASGNFTLTITQSVPFSSPASASLVGTLSGTVENGCGAFPLATCVVAKVTFAQTSVTIGGVEYKLNSDTYLLPVAHTSTSVAPGLGSDTITMTIVGGQVPEPAFMTLTGFGLAGLAFIAYRRRRTV